MAPEDLGRPGGGGQSLHVPQALRCCAAAVPGATPSRPTPRLRFVSTWGRQLRCDTSVDSNLPAAACFQEPPPSLCPRNPQGLAARPHCRVAPRDTGNSPVPQEQGPGETKGTASRSGRGDLRAADRPEPPGTEGVDGAVETFAGTDLWPQETASSGHLAGKIRRLGQASGFEPGG